MPEKEYYEIPDKNEKTKIWIKWIKKKKNKMNKKINEIVKK